MRPRVILRLLLLVPVLLTGIVTASDTVSIPTTYHAVTNRNVYAEPALPSLGPAGSRFIDPTFGSRMLRVTDADTRPNKIGRGYAGPSAAHQNAWNTTATRFYVRGIDGFFLPYTFDAASMTASRINRTTTGDGGLLISSQVEPQFSFRSPDILYVSSQSSSDTPVIRGYNFATNSYSTIADLKVDLNTAIASATYAAALSSSAASPEKVSVIFGGCCQDRHYKAAVFEVNSPASSAAVLDTQAGTITAGGITRATGIVPFYLHHAWIDLSGRYVVLYPVSHSPASMIVWDLTSHTLTLNNTRAFGHDALGYGWQVNQDCCTSSAPYDGAQWQLRTLSVPGATSDLISPMLSPRQIYIADHTSWNNAQPDRRVPILSSTYRYYNGTFNTAPWRAWDDEIIAIQTEAGDAGATVWRFAHHRSNVARDDGVDGTYFWYQPHAVVAPNGRWALFTSNWEKTLGTAVGAEPSGLYRTDVFIVALSAGSFTDDPLISGGTVARAIHVTELRNRIDVLRVRYGLGTFPWTDPALGPGATVQAVHLTELRTALQQAYAAASRTFPGVTDTITARSTRIRAVHVQELRDAVVALEGN